MMIAGERIRQRGRYFVFAVVVLALDQATKLMADAWLRERGRVEIVPGWFDLWYSTNLGGLFGYFSDWPSPWRALLLTLLPIVAIVLIGSILLRGDVADRITPLGLSLILGGAVGNLIDRLVRGEVVDFLHAYVGPSDLADRLVAWFGTSHWPTFNVADSAIVVGACLLLLSVFRTPKPAGSAG
jgi:signal peptidase II